MRRPAATTIVAVLVAVLAGCAPPAPDPGGASALVSLPKGVAVSLVQLRGDVAERLAQVHIVNDADVALSVTGVEVSDPRFAGTATRAVDRETLVPPGRTVDVRVQLPPMECAVGDTGRSTLAIGFTSDTGSGHAEVDLPDSLGFLPALHARECLGEALARVARIMPVAFVAAPAGERGSLRLEIEPTGAGSARIDAVQSTPLLAFGDGTPGSEDDGTRYRVDLDIRPGTAPIVLDIPLAPARCDPHVVQEDKRGTVFTLDLEVNAVAGQVDIAVPAVMKAEMLSWVADWCGFGT